MSDRITSLRQQQMEAEATLAKAQLRFNELIRFLMNCKLEIDEAAERVRHLGVQVRAEYEAHLATQQPGDGSVEA